MRLRTASNYFAYALIAVLVGSVISVMPTVQQSYASHNNIEVDIDKLEYGQGDDVVISGSIEDVNDDEDSLEIRVTKAGGGSDTDEVELGTSGNYDFVYELANNADDGVYTVRVTYDNEIVYSYFIVDEEDDAITVVLDEESYEAGADVEISGEVGDVGSVDEVEITILDPANDEVLDSQDEDVDSSDEFSHTFELDGDAEHGRYAVTVTYDDADEGYAIFEVEDEDAGVEPITVEVDSSYEPGETVEISGEVADVVSSEEVQVVVTDAGGAEVFEDEAEPESNGSFEFEFDLEDDADEGEYTVTVSYDGDDIEVTFDVSEGTSGGGSSSSSITVGLNKASYLAGDSMTVSGKVPKLVSDGVVNIDVFDPDGIFAGVFATTEPASSLLYSATLELPNDLDVDEGYTVRVNYGSYSGEAEFEISGQSNTSDELTVETDRDEYEIGSTVEITGTIDGDSVVEDQKVLIRVNKPDGNPYRIDIVDPSSSGSYSYEVVIGGELAIIGEYEVVVTYGDDEATAEFELVSGEAPAYNLMVDGDAYPIQYEITGGEVKSMFVRASDSKLVVSIDATEDGQLVLTLPRSVIDSVVNGTDQQYVVATADLEAGVGNDNVDISESDTTEEMRTIVIDYEAGTDLIEISGTSVVPEFGAVSAVVLAVALVGIIVAAARMQKFNFLK